MKISRNALLEFSHQDKHARNRIQINFESVVYPIFRIAIFSFLSPFFFTCFIFLLVFFFSRREAIKIICPWVKRHAAEFRFEADLIRLAAITNAVIANSDWEREHPLVPVRYFLIVRLINEQKIADVPPFMEKRAEVADYAHGHDFRAQKLIPGAIRSRDLLAR